MPSIGMGVRIGRKMSGECYWNTLIKLLSNLLPTKGSDSVTFARTGQQAVIDHEGVYRFVADGCAGFPGARQVTNLLKDSEDFTSATSAWYGDYSGLEYFTETVAGPYGVNVLANKLVCDGSTGGHYIRQQGIANIKYNTIAIGALVKKGTCRYVSLLCPNIITTLTFDLDTGMWVEPILGTAKRFWVQKLQNGWYWIWTSDAPNNTGINFRLHPQKTSSYTYSETSSEILYLLKMQLVDISGAIQFAPIDYVKTTNAIKTESFSTEQNNQQISVWGDSLSNTTMTDQLSYRITERIINNEGVGGEASTAIKNRMIAATSQYGDITVIWAGRNDWARPVFDKATVQANITTMVNALGHSRFIVLTVLNGEYAEEYAGTSGYDDMILCNQWIASTYPDNYIDIRGYLISQSTHAGQDATDDTHDIVPASLRADNIHLTPTGNTLVAIQLYSFMRVKAWLDDAYVWKDIIGLNGMLLEPARTNFCTSYGLNDVAAFNATPTNMTKSGNATATLKNKGGGVLINKLWGLGPYKLGTQYVSVLDNSLGGSGNAIATIEGSDATSPHSYSVYAMVNTGTAILQNDSGEGAVDITNTTPEIIKSENVTIGGARKLQLIAPIGTILTFCLCQAEVGSKATSFIVTAGAAATRAATTATLPIPAKGTKVRTTETKSGVTANVDRNIADYTTTIKVGTVDTGVYAEPVQVKDLMIK